MEDLSTLLMEDSEEKLKHQYFELLNRIVEGAKYIESIGPCHPKYDAAMRKYDGLYAEAGELQKQLRKGA